MKRLLVALAILLPLPAHAQQTKAALTTEINTNFATGVPGGITAATLRTTTTDIINSIMPTAPVVNNNTACFDGITGLLKDCGVAPSTLIVGTTVITGGTTTRVLFDNAGVLGEYTLVPLAVGGSNAALVADLGGVVYSDASKLVILPHTATANLPLVSGASSAPSWAAVSHPATATSGGVAYFSSTTAMTSSALLTANALVVGGGAGGAPNTPTGLGTTTTLLHGNAGGAPAFSAVAFADIATAALSTSAQLRAGTASTLPAADIIYDPEATITFNATQTFDFSTFLNGRITLTANITSLTCSNIKASQSGTITLVQDGTGSRTMVAGWCSQFRWAGGGRGVLSTAINSIDALFYQCVTTAICYVSLAKAQAN